MCAACTALLTGGWAEDAGARQVRMHVLGQFLGHFGFTLNDWESVCVLRDSRDGWAVVADVSLLWEEAARMAGHPLDPLDPELLAAID